MQHYHQLVKVLRETANIGVKDVNIIQDILFSHGSFWWIATFVIGVLVTALFFFFRLLFTVPCLLL